MSKSVLKGAGKEGFFPDSSALRQQANKSSLKPNAREGAANRTPNESVNKTTGSKPEIPSDSQIQDSKQFDQESNPDDSRKTPTDLLQQDDNPEERIQDQGASTNQAKQKSLTQKMNAPQGAKSGLMRADTSALIRDSNTGSQAKKKTTIGQNLNANASANSSPSSATLNNVMGSGNKSAAQGNRPQSTQGQPKQPNSASAKPGELGSGKSATGLATAAVAFAKDFASNKVKTSNVKVVARFRPLNKMENELTATGVGSECVTFPSDQEVNVNPDNQIFTLDRIFRPDCRQDEIYDFLGAETIEDVLNGYNGTIFAYGQTGSGKTHTMYGNIHDPESKGVIPRASAHIFEYIDNIKIDIDLYIKCSMLEIYKENLYDLLLGFEGEKSEKNAELKIKENPRRGIFIEGLLQMDVQSTEELIDLLAFGDKQRTVAATRMNNYSSRSHSLFIMEIIQKFPSEAEKRGKLNLVDLAGSEKVGKTGATGDTLEEAKKINLSLSSLGFVIHALTSNYEHIPYRDSKLTRILQESLGGNYKTALIVACSPHSSNKEEIISTLKFASRAKIIKNQYKMNIQNSPEALMAVIESLKVELEDYKGELAKYKEGGMIPGQNPGMNDAFQRNWSRFRSANNALEGGETTESHYEEFQKYVQLDVFDPMKNMERIREERMKNKERDDMAKDPDNLDKVDIVAQILSMKLDENSKKAVLSIVNLELGNIYQKKDYHSYSYYKTNLELLNLNDNLELRMNQLSMELNRTKRELVDKDGKIKEQEDEIRLMKSQLLQYENKINMLTEENSSMQLTLDTNTDNLDTQRLTIEILEKQVYAINEALNNTQTSIEKILSEKSRLVNARFQEFAEDDIIFKEIKLPDYFKHSYNFNFEPFYNQVPQSMILNPNYNEAKEPNNFISLRNMTHSDDPLYTIESNMDKGMITEEDKNNEDGDEGSYSQLDNISRADRSSNALDDHKRTPQKESFISNLDLQNAFSNASDNLRELLEVPYTVHSLLNKLQANMKDEPRSENNKNVSHEFMIYLLKQQLLQTCIINQHLERTIAALEWKQIIEYGKAKIKSNYMKMQERHIANLDRVLDKSRHSHEQLRNRVEAVELETIKLRESVLNVGPGAGIHMEPPKISNSKASKARILKSMRHDARKITRPVSAARFHNNTAETPVAKDVKNALGVNFGTNNDPQSSQRLHTETESHELSEKKDNKNFYSFAGYTSPSRSNIDNKTNDPIVFLKEIDEEIQSTSTDPNNIEEAKLTISMKNNIITKMRTHIANSSSTVNRDSGYNDVNQNLIQYLKYENDRLENKLLLLHTELDVEKTRSEQIKEAWNEQKKQMTKLSHLNTELEIAGRNALKRENASWQKILDEIKFTHQKEMLRKQEEVTKLHDLLAGWVFRYMELQESKGILPTHPEKMLFETFKRKEVPQKSLLEKALSTSKSTIQLNTYSGAGISTPRKLKSPETKTVDLNINNSPLPRHTHTLSASRSKKSLNIRDSFR